MAIKTGDKIIGPMFKFIPDELKEHSQWLLWQAHPIENNPGELTKVPVTIEGKKFWGWNNPKNLYCFEEVEKAFQTGKFTGVGFVLVGTDFICIDLDNNVSAANISDELLSLTRSGYTEFSPSGKGFHIWLKGKKPNGMGKNGHTVSGEKLEVFGNSGWVTVTGDVAISASIEENQPIINELYESYFKKKTN